MALTTSLAAADVPARPGWRWPLVLAALAVTLPLVGSYGAGWGLWHFRFGLYAIAASLPLAVIALLAGLIGLVQRRRPVWPLLMALLLAGAVAAVCGNWVRTAFTVPPIHDISTDLANPPSFEKLSLRADNLVGVESMQQWQRLHRKAYGDIRPVMLNMPPDRAVALVRQALARRDWAIALNRADRIEATETISPFRFKDDIVILVQPSPTGGSIIQIRSVSRIGVSDLGVNARRVRALIKDIRALAGERV